MLQTRDNNREDGPRHVRDTDRTERYRSFVRHSTDGIWCFEADPSIVVDAPEDDVIADILRHGRIVECNDAMARMYGFESADDMLGMALGDLLRPDDAKNVEFIRQFVRSGFRLEDAETIEVNASRTERAFLRSLVGDVVGDRLERAWGRQRDLTEQKNVERALRESEDRLRQSQKMEAVGRLAGGVAHDFNNILTVINGYSDMLLKRLDAASSAHNDAVEIRKAGERAKTLIRQLLTFSRKRPVSPSALSLNETLTEMEKMLHRLIGEDVDLELDLDPSIGTIFADPGSIEQVLMNLVVNSRDAMPRGGRLRIETVDAHIRSAVHHRTGSLERGRYVLLVVTDTGEGMDEDTQEHLFEPFFTTKGETNGTGLGLATVYAVVGQCGGHISVRSQVGEGTTFSIYLPAVRRARAAEPVEIPRESVRGGTETILVVEDADDVRKFIRGVLELSGYAVISAPNGESALRACDEFGGRIDLLVTDVIMPTMDGAELRRQLTERQPAMKTVFMSGYHDNAVLSECLAEGEARFLAKPFTPATLTDKVRAVLES